MTPPANRRRVLILWDPQIDADFRRRFDDMLADFDIDAADADAVDHDPEAPAPVTLAMASAASSRLSDAADIVVLAGPGHAGAANGALRLDISDLEHGSRRWEMLAERLRVKLGRENLGLPAGQLRARLDETAQRAAESERARAAFERQWNEAVRERDQAKNMLASAQGEIGALKAELRERDSAVRELQLLAEEFRYALPATLSAPDRDAAAKGRDHLWRARLSAARAEELAQAKTDTLSWAKAGATYTGETKDGRPEGFGVLEFREAGRVVSVYRGEFNKGRRHGHGVDEEHDGHVWAGEWRNDEATGFGCLTTPNGARFEGETTPGPDGAPQRGAGCVWEASARRTTTGRRPLHSAYALQLPAPGQSALGK